MLSLYLILICIILFFTTIFLLMLGGKYLKAKLKEKIPFFHGDYNWVFTFKNGGPIVVDYVKTKGGKAKTTEEETQLETTQHSMIDKATQHSYDKKPAYVIVEGSPLNVLVKKRDYQPTIVEIQKYKAKIKHIISKKDKRYSIGLINIFISKFKKLNEAFEYLPQGRVILDKIFSDYNPNKVYTLVELNTYLERIHNGLTALQNLLKDKDKTMINFTDYFSSGNLARIFNKRFQEAQSNGRLQMAQEYDEGNKLVKIGGTIVVIIILILGFLVFKQGNQIDSLNETVIKQTNTISEKIDDMNTHQIFKSPNLNQNPVLTTNNSGNNG